MRILSFVILQLENLEFWYPEATKKDAQLKKCKKQLY